MDITRREITPELNSYYLYRSLNKLIKQVEDGYITDYEIFYKNIKHQIKMFDERSKRIKERKYDSGRNISKQNKEI